VKVVAQRRKAGRWRTLREPLVRRCRAGAARVPLEALLGKARAPMRLLVSAVDAAGNRGRPVRIRVR
jgi:hypothetical protein